MGSVKKKVNKVFNKVADKLVPKELAPFLPIAAMMIPGAGIFSSTLMRYAVPQVLTALGDAKQHGKINLAKQAMAAGASYLGGPMSETAASNAAATPDTNAITTNVQPGPANNFTGVQVTPGTAGSSITSANATASDFANYTDVLKSGDYVKPDSLFGADGSIMQTTKNLTNQAKNLYQYDVNNLSDLGNLADVAGNTTTVAGLSLGYDEGLKNKAEMQRYKDDPFYKQNTSDYDFYISQIYDSMIRAGYSEEEAREAANASKSDYYFGKGKTSSDFYAAQGGLAKRPRYAIGGMLSESSVGNAMSSNMPQQATGIRATEEAAQASADFAEAAVGPGFPPEYYDYIREVIEGAIDPQSVPFEEYLRLKDQVQGATQMQAEKEQELALQEEQMSNSLVNQLLQSSADSVGSTGNPQTSTQEAFMELVTYYMAKGLPEDAAQEAAMQAVSQNQIPMEDTRVQANTGGIMNAAPQAPGVPGGMELDYRNSGGFIPMGGPEKADDVPAMLSKNEFVMTADAVRGAGNGDINVGAQKMYDLMNNLQAKV